ncbi:MULTISPECIES: N-6 DNA methylase [unclassified Prevotella]|uniref:Eco57I restriction-modification methylase domain-containing protein n=1 Tax=unclassified Prevotella TaxID=2638335 RepID=UPI0006885524|nr:MULTISPECIES: N-6 DNA methylase [unclassified Prevotella]
MDYRPIIESRYNRESWQKLLHDIFNGKEKFWATPSVVPTSSPFAKQALWLGTITLSDEQTIAIYEVELSDSVDIERNRRGIRDMLLSSWRNNGNAGAFMFCYRKNESVLRFSYVSESWKFADDGSYQKESTDTRRFTYLLGEGHRSRTAIQQFEKLRDSSLSLKDLTKAFSVDAVSDMFFDGYKKQYEDIIQYVTGKRMVKVANKWEEQIKNDPCEEIMQEFARFQNPEKAVRDYVKKLMGRIVFLQFLQKKGWMGVPVNKEWGEGDTEFIQTLFENSTDKDHFVDEVLEPLFDDLNSERANDLVSPKVGRNIRVPYLNGGLFEREATDETAFPLPAKYMKSMLDFFASYNFTIDENDPDDAEVGVDPEMLGRIFENLLEDNKDKGAFYTPKEIVSYMCRESLIAYLQTDIENEQQKEAIREFVTNHKVQEHLPENVDQRLKDVKICDPAIGSGAFPMGLLKELFLCRTALEGITQSKAAEIKKHIIQQNIYGVDIERGAVDIARLRFWLSLIVDEETPQALPNLDFKIMQGNSLLEQYKGIDLSTMTEAKWNKNESLSLFEDMLDVYRREMRIMITQYYDCTNRDDKKKLKAEILENVENQLIEQHVNVNAINVNLNGNDQFFLWHTWFFDVFSQGGFDIVIGNPPYFVYQENHVGEIKELRNIKEYKIAFGGKLNAYKLFIANALNVLCREDGIMCVICQNSLLADRQATCLRKHIFENAQFISIDSFPERDSKKKRVFESVKMSVCIPIVRKRKTKDYFQVYIWDDKYKKSGLETKFNNIEIKSMDAVDYAIPRLKSEYTPIVIKIINCKHFGLKCIEGELNMTFHKKYFTDKRTNPTILKGAAIQRYYYTLQMSQGEIEYLDEKMYLRDYGNTEKSKHHNYQRIAMQGMTGANDKVRIVMALVPEGYYLANSCNYLSAPEGIDIYALLGILNSKLINWFFRCFSTNSNVNGYEIDNLPIPDIQDDVQLDLRKLVISVMENKKQNNYADTQDEESRIDEIVYKLYDLTKDEIKIIEE